MYLLKLLKTGLRNILRWIIAKIKKTISHLSYNTSHLCSPKRLPNKHSKNDEIYLSLHADRIRFYQLYCSCAWFNTRPCALISGSIAMILAMIAIHTCTRGNNSETTTHNRWRRRLRRLRHVVRASSPQIKSMILFIVMYVSAHQLNYCCINGTICVCVCGAIA